jgi:predicted enzyme related to lactoylglutathione lyase
MLTRPLLRSLVSSKPFYSTQLNTARRTMATAGKFEYLVIVPDKPGMLAKRLEVRP